jgi:hypothetical protein
MHRAAGKGGRNHHHPFIRRGQFTAVGAILAPCFVVFASEFEKGLGSARNGRPTPARPCGSKYGAEQMHVVRLVERRP